MINIHERIIEQIESAPIRDIAVGAFWTAVLAEDPLRCGLASMIRPEYLHNEMVTERGYPLQSQNVEALVRLFLSDDPVEAGIGLATVNALIPVPDTSLQNINVADMLQESVVKKTVVVVGHFPFVNDLRDVASECHVLELRPREGDLPADRAQDVVPSAEIAVISSTTLMNGSFKELYSLCPDGCAVFLVGGSTPLTPVLFDYGIDYLAGTVVKDPMAAFRAVQQGARFPQIPGRMPVIMSRNAIWNNTEEI